MLDWCFSTGQQRKNKCYCGRPFPLLESYTFTLISERQVVYFLGQCNQCHTIYWRDV